MEGPVPTTSIPIQEALLDKVRGMLLGVALGDALGAPFEFRRGPKVEYTGRLEHQTAVPSRHMGTRYLPVGSITDDTQMTMALARSLVRRGGYDREDVLLSYLRWANIPAIPMGRNTRALLQGVTTVRGWEGRVKKIQELPEERQSHSNGPLMRCAPLALLPTLDPVVTDVSLTNPYPPVIDAVLVHVFLLRYLLSLTPGDLEGLQLVLSKQLSIAQTPIVRETLESAARTLDPTSRDLVTHKGWVMHPLWLTAYVLRQIVIGTPGFQSFPEIMKWVITTFPGSDTDTNASIVGGAVGVWFGYQTMISFPGMKENVSKLLEANQGTNVLRAPGQPSSSISPEFGLQGLEEIAQGLAHLSLPK